MPVVVPLTSLSHGAGCGCKLPAAAIGSLLSSLPAVEPDPAVIVGFQTSDDAGVYQLTDELALVHTVDFFTPIVDDPFDFGRIAATNALSDVYAMGATPVSALNLVAYSIEDLGEEILRDILRGAAATARAAEVAILGGHSIDDPEPKFGLAVTGVVHPDQVLTNDGEHARSCGEGGPEARGWLACDAMTSGGLLAAAPPDKAAAVPGAHIGRLTPGEPGTIELA